MIRAKRKAKVSGLLGLDKLTRSQAREMASMQEPDRHEDEDDDSYKPEASYDGDDESLPELDEQQVNETTSKDGDDDSLPEVDELHVNDVLVGRGNFTSRYPGNIHFRCVVWDHKKEYARAANQKSAVAAKVLKLIRDAGGRVVERRAKRGGGYVHLLVSQKQAIEKTCQALREKKHTQPPDGYNDYCRRRKKMKQVKKSKTPATTVTAPVSGRVADKLMVVSQLQNQTESRTKSRSSRVAPPSNEVRKKKICASATSSVSQSQSSFCGKKRSAPSSDASRAWKKRVSSQTKKVIAQHKNHRESQLKEAPTKKKQITKATSSHQLPTRLTGAKQALQGFRNAKPQECAGSMRHCPSSTSTKTDGGAKAMKNTEDEAKLEPQSIALTPPSPPLGQGELSLPHRSASETQDQASGSPPSLESKTTEGWEHLESCKPPAASRQSSAHDLDKLFDVLPPSLNAFNSGGMFSSPAGAPKKTHKIPPPSTALVPALWRSLSQAAVPASSKTNQQHTRAIYCEARRCRDPLLDDEDDDENHQDSLLDHPSLTAFASGTFFGDVLSKDTKLGNAASAKVAPCDVLLRAVSSSGSSKPADWSESPAVPVPLFRSFSRQTSVAGLGPGGSVRKSESPSPITNASPNTVAITKDFWEDEAIMAVKPPPLLRPKSSAASAASFLGSFAMSGCRTKGGPDDDPFQAAAMPPPPLDRRKSSLSVMGFFSTNIQDMGCNMPPPPLDRRKSSMSVMGIFSANATAARDDVCKDSDATPPPPLLRAKSSMSMVSVFELFASSELDPPSLQAHNSLSSVAGGPAEHSLLTFELQHDQVHQQDDLHEAAMAMMNFSNARSVSSADN